MFAGVHIIALSLYLVRSDSTSVNMSHTFPAPIKAAGHENISEWIISATEFGERVHPNGLNIPHLLRKETSVSIDLPASS